MKTASIALLITLFFSSCQAHIEDKTAMQYLIADDYTNPELLYVHESEKCYIAHHNSNPAKIKLVWVIESKDFHLFPFDKGVFGVNLFTEQDSIPIISSTNDNLLLEQNETNTYVKFEGIVLNKYMPKLNKKLTLLKYGYINLKYNHYEIKYEAWYDRTIGKPDYFTLNKPIPFKSTKFKIVPEDLVDNEILNYTDSYEDSTNKFQNKGLNLKFDLDIGINYLDCANKIIDLNNKDSVKLTKLLNENFEFNDKNKSNSRPYTESYTVHNTIDTLISIISKNHVFDLPKNFNYYNYQSVKKNMINEFGKPNFIATNITSNDTTYYWFKAQNLIRLFPLYNHTKTSSAYSVFYFDVIYYAALLRLKNNKTIKENKHK